MIVYLSMNKGFLSPTSIRLLGLFLVLVARENNEQLFLSHRNSNELTSSKGRMSLFLFSTLQLGFDIRDMSSNTSFITWPQLLPVCMVSRRYR